ncbi:hypothetical protein GCM10022631_10660 [Deinococcus rubellus]|uniref:hypothetical protein n=1 Tax=Deinococcus rubellus TaxID=1889240 RepID=UPI0031E7E70E
MTLPFPFAALLTTRAALTQELAKIGRAHELDDMELASRAGRRDKVVFFLDPQAAPRFNELLTEAGFRVELEDAAFDDELLSTVVTGRVYW